jgi:hypothetical protein
VLLCAFRARHAYRRRRDLLLHALTGRFPWLQVGGAAAGMQLLLPLPGQTDDIILAQAAAARGIGITALSPLHLARSPDRGLLLGFGRLPGHKVPAAVDALWSVLSQAGAASTPAAARHVADQPGDPPRLEVRQPAIRSDRADMWPGLPTATNTARPTESFSTNRKLTSRDSCPLSAVLVRPVRVAYIPDPGCLAVLRVERHDRQAPG